jgi:hypothetical protein
MTSITAAITGLKAATDLAQSFVNLKTSGEIQGKVVELQTVILAAQGSALAAQSEQFTLLDRIRNLETEIIQFENWEAEKQRYQLTDYGSGTFAYALKPSEAYGEPPHRICANCYNQGHKSLLQVLSIGSGQEHTQCSRCKTEVFLGTYSPRSSGYMASSDF